MPRLAPLTTLPLGSPLVACALVALAGCGTVTIDTDSVGGLADVFDVIDDITQTESKGGGGGGGTDGSPSDAAGDECITDFDCNGQVKGTTPCLLPACDNGFCVKKQKETGAACTNPGDVLGDCEASTCDDTGNCAIADLADGAACGGVTCGKLCKAGSCVIAPDDAYDDGNPCTKDFCNQGLAIVHEGFTDLTVACDDGDACTEGGVCIEGKCAGKPLDCSDGIGCTVDTCLPGEGCKHVANNGGCDDGDPCSKDACDLAAGCTVTGANAGAACDDGNTCTDKDACTDSGACLGTSTCTCKTDDDCSSDNLCLGPLACVEGLCEAVPGKAVICDTSEDSACAKAQCQPSSGTCAMVAAPSGTECDDGDPCTSSSTCEAGACQAKTIANCDDDNPCTDDSCNKLSGCINVATSAACDDGNPCTEQDACINGGCSGVAKACDDGVGCTLDACDKSSGKCQNTAQAASCDDNNPCTADQCDATAGCQNPPDDKGTCSDGDSCTVDACKGGTCTSTNTCPCKVETGAADCDDNNPCTIDSCDEAAKACKNEAAGADGKGCDTGDKCQQPGSGQCAAGVCKSGNKPVDCSGKSGPCATGTCNAASGACEASPKADGLGCDADGSVCTANDACKGGSCVAGATVKCNDGNPCTLDACDKVKGCTAAPLNTGACDDGDACTDSDACAAGKCQGTAKSCDDGNPCTTDSCDKALGCKTAANTAACDDGTVCTEGDVCSGGACKPGKAKNCDDNNPCTTDSCDKTAGCKNANNTAACNDGDAWAIGGQVADAYKKL